MKICGIELKSNNAIVSIIESSNEEINYIDVKLKKIILDNDEDKSSLLSFKNDIESFLTENHIEKVAIKKRAKKGTFAGGSITFKMEAVIQLNSISEVEFISSQAISKYTKKNEIEFPSLLNKYQEQSYLSAVLLT